MQGRAVRAAQEQAEAVIELSQEHGFTFWLLLGNIARWWALAEQGQGEEAIVQMRQGLDVHRAGGAELARSGFLSFCAEAYGHVGQIVEGLAVLKEALEVVDKTGERYYEAGLYRLKGEFVLQFEGQSRDAEAEACFYKALTVARQQQARLFELRAATSLARLWQQQGKQAETRELLAPVYNWFTEGFDTADLKEAKALLETLT